MASNLLRAFGLITVAALCGVAPHGARAANPFPHYVYTNDDQPANTVTGFSVAANGSLTKIGQWATGGTGCFGFYALNSAKIVKHGSNGDILFASNNCSNTVSVFSGAAGGALTLLSQVPLPASGGNSGASIASNGHCVVFGLSSGEVDSYVYPNLTHAVSTIYLSSAVDGMSIVTQGSLSYLVAAEPYTSSIGVATLSSTCGLVAQAPIVPTSGLLVDGVAFNPDHTILYVGDANSTETSVQAFTFPAGTPLVGSPYSYATGLNSNTVLVSKNGRCLFVANELSSTVTAIPLSAAGVPGTRATAYPAGLSGTPSGMAPDVTGKMFYVASGFDNTVTTEVIGKNCALTEAPGTPLATGAASGTRLDSLTAFP